MRWKKDVASSLMIRYSGVARHQQTTVGDGGKEAVGKPVVANAGSVPARHDAGTLVRECGD